MNLLYMPSLDMDLMSALPKLTLLMTRSWKRLLLIAGLAVSKEIRNMKPNEKRNVLYWWFMVNVYHIGGKG
jgi:hypothetical protein